jgi:cation-transporting P-type ATPase E
MADSMATTAKLPVVTKSPPPDLAPAEIELLSLTEVEAAARAARGEANVAAEATSRSYSRIIVQNTISFINTLLFSIVVFLAVLGLYSDAAMTAVLVVANVVVGTFQEIRAKRKLDQIALLTRPTATVIRDKKERTIDPSQVVKGDLLVLKPGDQVLVDGIVVQDSSLSVDESLLTGESDLVQKAKGAEVFSGSFCMTGSGIYRAEKVGAASLANEMTGQARAYRNVMTPLQREIGFVIRVMVVLMVALGAQVADTFRSLYQDVPLTESVRAAAVIVALVPQGLIFMVTVTYAMAAVRMSGKGALIQRMNAVESTSQIDTLCMDKTGTLTTNNLALHTVHPLGRSEAEVRQMLGHYAAATPTANRTIDAIRAAGPAEPGTPATEIPFSSARKWSALAFDGSADAGTFVLGAPEMLQPALQLGDTHDQRIEVWADEGLRVLLFGYYPDPNAIDPDNPALPGGMTPLGLLAFSDELRPEARTTIEGFREAGIGLKIISGDNPDTVAALAKQAGFPHDLRVVSGLELEKLDDEALKKVAREVTVFGRITPSQKESLVKALRAEGHYVAMTGDGVNDVLALKQANLAIAMQSGSQVTRGVADIVLLQDSFAALPAAFLEGQRILKGMQDIIRLFLVRTLYVSLIIFAVARMGEEFPVTPKQNALLALATVGMPVLFLAAWARPGPTPRRLVPSSSHFVIPAALTIAAVGTIVYMFFLTMTGELGQARTALTITTIVCGLALIVFSEPPTSEWTGGDELSGDWRPTILAGVTLLIFCIGLYIEPIRNFYELETMPFTSYLIIGLVVTGWSSILRYLWRLHVVDWSWEHLRDYIVSVRRRMARKKVTVWDQDEDGRDSGTGIRG